MRKANSLSLALFLPALLWLLPFREAEKGLSGRVPDLRALRGRKTPDIRRTRRDRLIIPVLSNCVSALAERPRLEHTHDNQLEQIGRADGLLAPSLWCARPGCLLGVLTWGNLLLLLFEAFAKDKQKPVTRYNSPYTIRCN